MIHQGNQRWIREREEVNGDWSKIFLFIIRCDDPHSDKYGITLREEIFGEKKFLCELIAAK